MKIIKKEEYNLTQGETTQLNDLLKTSFPGLFENRIYMKQLPHFRLLVKNNDKIIAQTGVDYRVVRVGDKVFRVFGVIDLCVESSFRKRKIAEKLLDEVFSLIKKNYGDFIVLFADDHRLYKRLGYQLKKNKCTWLGVDEHKTVGIIEDVLDDCLMVKEVSGQKWPEGKFDMLGYLY